MDRPFYYRSADDVVPRDAVYVIVCGSVKVVPPHTFGWYEDYETDPPYTFEGYEHLARVDFEEGVEVIGRDAFYECPNLTTVDCRASSLRTIDDYAFFGCERLSEVMLREGLRRIGERAFKECGLERITVPSSVVEIGEQAFFECYQLSEVTLTEGLRKIGKWAFSHCLRLERINISSMAIVVEAGEDGSGRVVAVTGGIERDPANDSPRLIMASPHLELMPPEELTNLTDAIDQIVDTTRGAGPLDLADGDVSGRIRECFVERLSTWYGSYKREAAAILELALWKIELGRAAVGGEAAGGDAPTRDDYRINCGANPIVGLVLFSLSGPHRRADEEDAG